MPKLPTITLLVTISLAVVSLPSCGTGPSEDSAGPASAAGTVRMAERLRAIAADARPMKNQFMNRERLALLREMPRPEGLVDG